MFILFASVVHVFLIWNSCICCAETWLHYTLATNLKLILQVIQFFVGALFGSNRFKSVGICFCIAISCVFIRFVQIRFSFASILSAFDQDRFEDYGRYFIFGLFGFANLWIWTLDTVHSMWKLTKSKAGIGFLFICWYFVLFDAQDLNWKTDFKNEIRSLNGTKCNFWFSAVYFFHICFRLCTRLWPS